MGRLPHGRPAPAGNVSGLWDFGSSLGLPGVLWGSQAGEDWTAPVGCPSHAELTCLGAPPGVSDCLLWPGAAQQTPALRLPGRAPHLPLGLWQAPAGLPSPCQPQARALLWLAQPLPRHLWAPGSWWLLLTPPPSQGPVLGPLATFQGSLCPAVPSQEFWLTSSVARGPLEPLVPLQAASQGSWDEGLLCGYVGWFRLLRGELGYLRMR